MPDQTISIPGVGPVTFPASMSPDEINAAAKRLHDEATSGKPTKDDVQNLALADNPGLGWVGRAGQAILRMAAKDPVSTAAIAGAVAAAPVTGGASIPMAMTMAGLGGAGGAAAGMTGQALYDFATGSNTSQAHTATDVGNTMLRQGVANAAGEGVGRGVAKAAEVVVPIVNRNIMRPALGKLKEFPELLDVFRREQIPIGKSFRASDEATAASNETKNILFKRDQSRPKVAGLLPPGTEPVPMGTPYFEGEMPGALVPAHARVDPHVTDATTHRMSFDSRPNPIALPTAPPLGGPGTIRRPVNAPPGRGAYPGQIHPDEVAQGVSAARAEVADRPVSQPALDEITALEAAFHRDHPRAMSLSETNRLKSSAQGLSDRTRRALEAGNEVNDVPGHFNKGIATGAQRAIERVEPKVIPHNRRARQMIGLTEGLEKAEQAAPNISMNPMTWTGVQSRLSFLLDDLGRGGASPSGRAAAKTLLSRLTELLANSGGAGSQ